MPFFKVLIKKKPSRNSVKFYVPWKRKCNMLILALPRQKSFAPRPQSKSLKNPIISFSLIASNRYCKSIVEDFYGLNW